MFKMSKDEFSFCLSYARVGEVLLIVVCRHMWSAFVELLSITSMPCRLWRGLGAAA